MTKRLVALSILVSGQAAAFSSITLRSPITSCSRLQYKNPEEDYSYQNLPMNATIVYNDFEIRESESYSGEAGVPAAQAIEPGDKPSNKFISPIQMIKLVPKVQPIANSSVFFVAPVIEPPEAPSQIMDNAPSAPKPNGMKPKWSPRKKWGTAAFSSTNYLESLSPTAPSKEEDDNKSFHASLRNQQGVIRDEKLRSTREAMYEATRRTSPHEAIRNRMEQAEELRKKKEKERLENLYIERQQKLEEKRRLEREGKMTLERYAEERKRVDRIREDMDIERGAENTSNDVEIKRGIPILTPFLKKSQSTPLLIGNTITLQYKSLTPFQIKTLEVARSLHEEHRIKMVEDESSAGKEGGIEAAPIVAIVDHYTGEVEVTDKSKRFATLASVEIVRNKKGEPVTVNLMGVGRVFLHSYFSSKDAGLTKEELELNKLLEKIDFLRDGDEEEIDGTNDDEDDFSIMMAEFDMFLDDSSILTRASKHQDATKQRASSMHAITELYRTANKVYRLHEERRNLLSGLRAGQARLSFRQNENEVVEYDDWNADADEGESQMIQDFGFGTYGIFSTIPDLTKELMVHLDPYYSPAHREREEYEAEMASFVALRALEKCANPSELAAAMVAPSATERLYMAYGIMSRHRDELLMLVKKMNDDLTDCGEECSDLW